MRRRILAFIALAVTAAASLAGAAALGDDARAGSQAGKLTLVAYSTPRAAYAELIPAFNKTAAGRDTSFEQSYGASGEQARAVVAGLKADVVALSLEPDVTTLVKAKLVGRNWNKDAYKGIVTRSVVVFAVRQGNPKKIRDWEDLVKPGVEIVTPNVQTSGGAKWNTMAAYGAMRKKGKTHAQAVAYLRTFYKHIVSQDKSAREALQTFLAGRGDVLLAYENEAIFAQQQKQPIFYVIPKATIRIENPIAVTTNSQNRATARGVRPLPAHRTRAEDLRPQRLPAGEQGRAQGPQLPRPAVAVHDRVTRGLGEGGQAVLRPAHRDRDEDPGGERRLALAAREQALPGAAARPGRRSGLSLSTGVATAYLSLIVLLPLAALLWQSTKAGSDGFWQAISNPQSVAALKVTLVASLIVGLINAVMGTLIAWMLVRDRFLGQGFVNSLIDLPFALPTIVAGLTLLALYGPTSPVGINVAFTRTAIVLALLFVTLPFVVRTVQPVLLELDREMEEAAASLGASSFAIFRRIVFPNLLPAILSGVALAFARAIGEFGSVVLITGQPAVPDRGLVRLHLRADRERRPRGRGRGVGRPARHLLRRPAPDRRAAALGHETRCGSRVST